jgi:hypothetical protein
MLASSQREEGLTPTEESEGRSSTGRPIELADANADYIENFYNVARRHSGLNYLTRSNSRIYTQPTSTRPRCHNAGPPNGV